MPSEEIKSEYFHFVYEDKEINLFAERNQKIVKLLPELNEVIDATFNHTVSATKDSAIFMLGRICVRHFHDICLLASRGHGFAAYRTLRSMFEKFVDAEYMHKHPELIDDFFNFYLYQIKRLEGEETVKSIDPDFQITLNKLKIQSSKDPKKLFNRKTWSIKNLREKAEEIGADQLLIKYAYSYPNLFVHSSIHEIESSLREGHDGSLMPANGINHSEQPMADSAFLQSIRILIHVMDVIREHYNFQNVQDGIDKFTKQFEESW